jgi:polyisoprenoid-binding protein YceI
MMNCSAKNDKNQLIVGNLLFSCARLADNSCCMLRLLFVSLFGLLMGVEQINAQANYRVSLNDSRLIISGTSSLHAWQCRAEQLSGQLQAEVDGTNLKSVRSLVLNAIVMSIRSIKENGEYFEKAMDKNVYKALAADKHPNITFTLARINSMRASGNRTATIDAIGMLRIAGISKEIPLVVNGTLTTNGIIFEGSVPIKMKDFNVDPPTALFGTIKTGNEVVVEFKVVYREVK